MLPLIPLIPSLSLAVAVQFLLWFNLLFPYNTLTEGFDRKLFFIFSLAGIFIAGVSIIFYKVLSLDKMSRRDFIIFTVSTIFQILCVFSCVFFMISSLTGRLLFV